LTPQETQSTISNDNLEECDLIDVKSEIEEPADDNSFEDIEDQGNEDVDASANFQREDVESIVDSFQNCAKQFRKRKFSETNIKNSHESPKLTYEETISISRESSTLDEETELTEGSFNSAEECNRIRSKFTRVKKLPKMKQRQDDNLNECLKDEQPEEMKVMGIIQKTSADNNESEGPEEPKLHEEDTEEHNQSISSIDEADFNVCEKNFDKDGEALQMHLNNEDHEEEKSRSRLGIPC